MSSPLLLLTGPTGTGKTAVAIELCRLLNGEIVSADSMLIYRGCDIVTAKPTREERAAVPHHLVDICEPDEAFSAARWAEEARRAIEEIFARGKTPILCGGTGFYLKALLLPEHLAAVPPNPQLREELGIELATHGKARLHERLRGVDATAAQRLHPNDVARVIRAIEVAMGDGPAAAQPSIAPTRYSAFGLHVPREELYRRLDARVDAMLKNGALDELRGLLAAGISEVAPALRGVGYRQLLPALRDESVLPQAIELWKRDTRRYAKRQMTWLRHQLEVQWIEMTEPGGVAEEIAGQWRAEY